MCTWGSAWSVEPEEILQDPHPLPGRDGFRVELDAPDGQGAVPQPHDLALGGLGGDLQLLREARALDEQRVVARAGETLGKAAEQVRVPVEDRRGLAVHQPAGA